MYSASSVLPDLPIIHDMDGEVELNRFRNKLAQLNPDLYSVYLEAFAPIDTDDLNKNLCIKTPRGWHSRHIKNRHNLTTQQYRELLVAGDKVLNQFRLNAGLRRVHREF